MRYFPSLAAAAILIASAMTYAADPVGSYKVEGVNPGNLEPYSGTATVAKTGDTYRVTWIIDGTTYNGTGIGNSDFLAVSYRSGNDTGLALYGAEGGNWIGTWTYAGAKKLGGEKWLRK